MINTKYLTILIFVLFSFLLVSCKTNLSTNILNYDKQKKDQKLIIEDVINEVPDSTENVQWLLMNDGSISAQ